MKFVISALVIGAGILIFLWIFLNPATHVVELTQDGFRPLELTIRQGDIVRFMTTRDQPFWPASDQHPIHSEYPEFDPEKPVDANSTWSFRFNRVGVWKYHDHLYSFYRGTITVE